MKNKKLFFICNLIVLVAISFVVGSRNVEIGADTIVYYKYFYFDDKPFKYGYEPIFVIINKLFNFFNIDFSYYLAFIYIVFTTFLLAATKNFLDFLEFFGEKKYWYIYITVFLFISSWYLTFSFNGIRNGLALSFFYFSLSLFFGKKYFLAFVFYIISCFTHYSIFLFFPFFVIFFISFEIVTFIWIFVFFLYPFGVNELLFDLIYNHTGISVFNYFKNYASSYDVPWHGFVWKFYLYTLFYFLLIFISIFYFVENKRFFQRVSILYMFLTFPYLFFGFAAYPNRYAALAWLFIPMMQAFIYLALPIAEKNKLLLFAVVFPFSLYFFIRNFL